MSAEVLVIGGGPVGLTIALLLARHGLRVEVVEKRTEVAKEPSAVALDDECLRIWQGCGLTDLLCEDYAGGNEGQCVCTYLDQRGRPFLRIHQRTSDLGHPVAVTIHQGRIEEKLLGAVQQQPSIRVHRGTMVVRAVQDEHRVRIDCVNADGTVQHLHAPWLIACDGANSFIRRHLEIPMEGIELPHPWLIANLVDHGDPGHVMIRCRTEGAAVTMPIPHGLRRVEVRLDKDDDASWLHDESEVRRRLSAGWQGAMDAPIVCLAHRRFSAATATRWRDRRIFLAGDAAHVMPPFAGQGLAAGLRDAANLSFKIAGVSQGWLAPTTLDSYEQERRPHLERITRLARRLGRLMSPSSTAGAMLMHGAIRMIGTSTTLASKWLLRGPAIRPAIASGLIVRNGQAGRYLPQPMVIALDARCVPLDQLLGPRMTWIILGPHTGSTPRLQAPLLQPFDTVLMEGRDFRDPERRLRKHFGAGSLVLVRPDRVVLCHIAASRWRSSLFRSPSCRPDVSVLQQSHDRSSFSHSCSPPRLAAASPTAQTPPS